jgi:hypothetical protein
VNYYFTIDILVVFLSFLIINHKRTLTFYHPGAILLLYHVTFNSFRFYSVIKGANLSFSAYRFIEGASKEELMRALMFADIALISCSIAIALAENIGISKITRTRYIPVNQKLLNVILVFTIPLGIYGAATQLYIPSFELNTDIEGFNGFSFADTISTWFGLSMLALIYFRGFKTKYLLPLIIYLVIVAVQGGNRYRMVLPAMFLFITYLYYHKLRWPNGRQVILLLLLVFITNPLKEVGQLIKGGGSLKDITAVFRTSFESTSSGNADDQSFLDQYAMTLTEVDKKGKMYYGTTIAPLLVLPIPRSGWPDKPALNQWQLDISTKHRPFGAMGSIATLYGEAYANFRLTGIILIPALLFYLLTRWYRKVRVREMFDMDKFFYTLIFVCMIQVMRDGLVSIFTFPVLNNMPLFLIYFSHKVLYKRKKITLRKVSVNNFVRNNFIR